VGDPREREREQMRKELGMIYGVHADVDVTILL